MKKLLAGIFNFIPSHLPWILFIAILIPSSNFQLFNGFPFSGIVEYVLILTLLPFLFFRKFSRLHKILLSRISSRLSMAFLLSVIFVAGIKLAVFWSGAHAGFAGCYSSPAAPPTFGRCEKSYENPFQKSVMTRFDKTLDFDESNWNLGYVNSNRFNYYAWVPDSIDRKRMPLNAEWTGTIAVGRNQKILVNYVGEGQIRVGTMEASLPAFYQKTNQISLQIPQGVQALDVHYTFDDGYRIGDPTPGPYAMLQVWVVENSTGKHEPLESLPAPAGWRLAANLADVIIIVLWSSILYAYYVILKRRLVFLFLIFMLAQGIMEWPKPLILSRSGMLSILLVGIIIFLLLYRTRQQQKYSLLLAYLSFAIVGFQRALVQLHDIGAVIIRAGGGDFLTYQGFGREILETGSLRAGEAIFYYQPAYRYVLFLLHGALGDGDALISALSITALWWGMFLVANQLTQTVNIAGRFILLGIFSILLAMINNTQVLVELVMDGASEYPSWIILPIIIGIIISHRPRKYSTLVTFLIGLGMITRTDQIPALGILYVVFLIRVFQTKQKAPWRTLFLLTSIVLLPAVHNLFYGGKFELLPTSRELVESLAIPPLKALTNIRDQETQAILIRQTAVLLGIKNHNPSLNIPLHALQVIWLFSCLYAFFRWRKSDWPIRLLLFVVPLAYLGVFLFYFSHYDYPRHVLAGYLAMGLGVSVLASSLARQEIET